MHRKQSLRDIPDNRLDHATVLLRADLNIPEQLTNPTQISQHPRIQAILPTLTYLQQKKAIVVLISHRGRPNGRPQPALSMKPIAKSIEKALKASVTCCDHVIGHAVSETIKHQQPGSIVCLENSRFYPEETNNEPEFAKKLAALGTHFVFDAFGTAHRCHASTVGIANHLPSYSGFLVEKELKYLTPIFNHPPRPLTMIIGGSKISTKIGILKAMLTLADYLIIGGGMIFTLLKAQNRAIGKSLVENNELDTARIFLEQSQQTQTKVILPQDIICTTQLDHPEDARVTPIDQIGSDDRGVDMGPESLRHIDQIIKQSQLIVWNGPLGICEIPAFAKGTQHVANTLAKWDTTSIIGGGDLINVINNMGLTNAFSHISTGGGSLLKFLETGHLPALDGLANALE